MNNWVFVLLSVSQHVLFFKFKRRKQTKKIVAKHKKLLNGLSLLDLLIDEPHIYAKKHGVRAIIIYFFKFNSKIYL